MARRRVEREVEESGAEPNEGDWAIVMDEWILVVDAHNTHLQRTQESAAEAERKREEASNARENLFRRMGQKRTRPQENASDLDDDDERELSGDEIGARPAASSTRRSSPTVTSSSRRRKRPRPDDNESQSMIRANNAFADYLERSAGSLEQSSDTERRLETVENKLTELLDLLKAQFSR